MVIIDPSVVDFLTVKERMRNYTLLRVINHMSICDCLVSIPMFKIETELHLNDVLKRVCVQYKSIESKMNLSELIQTFSSFFLSRSEHSGDFHKSS